MFLAVIIFCSGSYWLIGFTHEFIKFAKLISVLSCMAIVGNSIGFWTGALFK